MQTATGFFPHQPAPPIRKPLQLDSFLLHKDTAQKPLGVGHFGKVWLVKYDPHRQQTMLQIKNENGFNEKAGPDEFNSQAAYQDEETFNNNYQRSLVK